MHVVSFASNPAYSLERTRDKSFFAGLSVDDMWEVYGEFLITYACETGWEKMLACMANNLQVNLNKI